ncbi:hypothetical protein MRQ36_31000 [Micromonospora sp. R77]|uniref:hypothetical protein n=1 Tax=Micromonospora sp. R77 TaxID=2925836 RepID=UPI001F602895|nr:hypothetical protein [Micromonospora sp. R77]MCI4066748.1 hypothetical protein [Micromonospora sp. R77]
MTQLDLPHPAAVTCSEHYATAPGLSSRRSSGRGRVVGGHLVAGDGTRDTAGYDVLARRIATGAHRLRAVGLRPGDPVAVTLANDLPTVTAALAVWPPAAPSSRCRRPRVGAGRSTRSASARCSTRWTAGCTSPRRSTRRP